MIERDERGKFTSDPLGRARDDLERDNQKKLHRFFRRELVKETEEEPKRNVGSADGGARPSTPIRMSPSERMNAGLKEARDAIRDGNRSVTVEVTEDRVDRY